MKYIFSAFLFILCLQLSVAAQGELNNRFRLAQSYEQAGEVQRALSIYEQLYKEKPDNFQFFDALNRVYIRLKNFDASISIVTSRLSSYPDDINLHGLLGSTYYQKGDEAKAFETWDRALSREGQQPIAYRVIANYAIERRALERAIYYLNEGRKISDEYYSFSFDLANLHSLLMHYRQAAEEYCYILSKQPEQLNLIMSRMSAYMTKQDARDNTISVVQEWEKKTGDVNFLLLLGWIYSEAQQFDRAFDTYIIIDKKRNSEGADLYNFAQNSLSGGDYATASKAFQEIIETYPSSNFVPPAKIGYARTLEAALDEKYATSSGSWKAYSRPVNEEEYSQVLKAYQEVQSLKNAGSAAEEAQYREGYIRLKRLSDTSGARQALSDFLQKHPVSLHAVPAFLLMADIYLLKGDISRAAEYFERVRNNSRTKPDEKLSASYMLARIEFFRGNFTQAVSQLNEISARMEDNSANDAIELSVIINTTKNDSLSLFEFAKAELFTEQYRFKEAAEIYRRLSTKEDLLTLKDLCEFRYAQMLTAENDYPAAITVLSSVSERGESSIYADKATLLLAQIYEFGIKDDAKAVEYYENLLAKFPNSLYLDYARENIISVKNRKK